MKINTDIIRINEILSRGVEEIIEKGSLTNRLKSGKKLRIKHGIDPTGPKIHIGRATQFHKLKALEDLGHQVVLIIGDFTAQIGDASDKQAMRKVLSEKEIKANMKGYEKQIGKILDLKKTEIRYNSEWLKKLTAKDLITLSMQFTAQQLIQRRNFKERWDAGKPIGAHELDYPLLQGYDSFIVKADIELGGSDQLFNLLAGREIQKHFKQIPQDIITLKMLNGLDGRKMSTSWGNIITIADKPNDIYGKIMSMKDELIPEYFELCTSLFLDKINKANPKELKSILAKEIIKTYYSEKEALKAEQNFERVFKGDEAPDDILEVEINENSLPILDLLVRVKIALTKSEARRLVEQKGIRIDKIIQDDWKKMIEIKKGMIIQAGKRKFAKIV